MKAWTRDEVWLTLKKAISDSFQINLSGILPTSRPDKDWNAVFGDYKTLSFHLNHDFGIKVSPAEMGPGQCPTAESIFELVMEKIGSLGQRP